MRLNLIHLPEHSIDIRLRYLTVVVVAKQSSANAGSVLAKEVCIVATLLAYKEPWLDLQQFARHPVIHHRRQANPTELVMDSRVKPARHKDQVRLKLPSNRKQQSFACMLIIVIPDGHNFVIASILFVNQRACLPCHVHIKTSAVTLAHVVTFAVFPERVKSKVITAVQRHQHDFVCFIKRVLGPITLVNVPIEDQHLLSLVNSVLSRYRNLIKEAEAISLGLVCVVARGSDNRITCCPFLRLRQTKVDTSEACIHCDPARIVRVHVFVVVFGVQVARALA